MSRNPSAFSRLRTPLLSAVAVLTLAWGGIELLGSAKAGNEPRAQEVYMLILNRFLRDSKRASELGARGRYWQSRLIFELGELLETEERFAEAEMVYDLVRAYDLPGRSLADARIAKFTAGRN